MLAWVWANAGNKPNSKRHSKARTHRSLMGPPLKLKTEFAAVSLAKLAPESKTECIQPEAHLRRHSLNGKCRTEHERQPVLHHARSDAASRQSPQRVR